MPNLSSVLSKLGWGSGFKLPNANEENRLLEIELEKKQRRALDINSELEEERRLCQDEKNLIDRVYNEIKITQKIFHAKKAAFEAEKILESLTDLQISSIKKEKDEILKKCQDLVPENKQNSNEIERRTKEINDLIKLVKWDQEILQKYKNSAKDYESEIKFLEKYFEIDNNIIKESNVKFQQLGEKLTISKRVLEDNLIYSRNLHLQMESFSAEIERLHRERREALNLWKNTVDSMKNRDNDIKKTGEEYAKFSRLVQKSKQDIELAQSALNDAEKNSFEANSELEIVNRMLESISKRSYDSNEKILEYKNSLLVFSTSVKNLSDDMKAERKQIEKLIEEAKELQIKNLKGEEEVFDLNKKLQKTKLGLNSSEEQTKTFEEMIEREDQRVNLMLRDLEKCRRLIFLKTTEIGKLKKIEEETDFRIKSSEKTFQEMVKEGKEILDFIEEKRQEIFNLDQILASLEGKINSFQEPTADNENNLINKLLIVEKREELIRLIEEKAVSLKGIKYLEEIKFKISKEIKESKSAHLEMKVKLTDVRCENNRYLDEEKKLEEAYKNLLVENSLLGMVKRKIQNNAKIQKEICYNSEKERLEIQTIVKERRAEIEIHKNILIAKKRILGEEKSRLNLSKSEILLDVDKLKIKYQVTMYTMASSEEGKEDQSEAYIILKRVQEKEILKQEGDLWDNRVKETEKELTALQNTLLLMLTSNDNFRDSLSPAALNIEQAKGHSSLEEERQEIEIRKGKAARKLKILFQEFTEKKKKIFQTSETISKLGVEIGDRKYELNGLLLEIESQRGKLQRANNVVSRSYKDLGLSEEGLKILDSDIKLRAIRERYNYAIKTLEKLVLIHPEFKDPAINYLEKTKLQSLVQRLTKISSRSTSPASSIAASIVSERERNKRGSSSEKFYSKNSKDDEFYNNNLSTNQKEKDKVKKSSFHG